MSAEQQPITHVMGDYFNLPHVQERYANIALMAAEIHKNRSEGSDDIQLEGITAISVGAHQDADMIWGALRSHVKSLGSKYSPRTQVILALDAPPGNSPKEAAEKEDAIRTFAKKHKHFPLSFFYTEYEFGTPSGTCRGDLADAGLLWARYLSKSRKPDLEDLAIIMNSIQEERRSVGYEHAMLTKLAVHGTIAAQGQIKYEPSGYTNIDKMMQWLYTPIEAGVSYSESNLGMSLRNAFVPAEGYDRQASAEDPQMMLRSLPLAKALVDQSSVKVARGAIVVLPSQDITTAALEGVLPGVVADTPQHVALRNRNGSDQDTRGISNEAYTSWTDSYQRDLLLHYGATALQQGGQAAFLKFVKKIEATRRRLGGKIISGLEVGKLLLNALNEQQVAE